MRSERSQRTMGHPVVLVAAAAIAVMVMGAAAQGGVVDTFTDQSVLQWDSGNTSPSKTVHFVGANTGVEFDVTLATNMGNLVTGGYKPGGVSYLADSGGINGSDWYEGSLAVTVSNFSGAPLGGITFQLLDVTGIRLVTNDIDFTSTVTPTTTISLGAPGAWGDEFDIALDGSAASMAGGSYAATLEWKNIDVESSGLYRSLSFEVGVAAFDLYWDMNGTTVGAGGPAPVGTWSAGNTNWNGLTDGTGTPDVWQAGYVARFAAGSDATDIYTVNVDGTHDIVGLGFDDGTVTLATTTGGQLRLVNNADVEVASGLTATIQTSITEDATPRSLAKKGDGTLVLSPGVVGYTGGTAVRAGTLGLDANAVFNGTAVTVAGDSAGVTATLDLAGHDDTVSSLTLGGASATSGASVITGAGTLTLNGDVTYDSTDAPLGATISGKLDLGSDTRTVTVGDSASASEDLTISADISGNTGRGLNKVGMGTLYLSGANTYTGQTILSAGVLRTSAPSVLPGYDSPGNVFFNGGTLLVVLDSGWTIGDVGTVVTNATKVSGAIALDTTSGDVAQPVAWDLGGLGLTKLGDNKLTLDQANTYTGATTVAAGTLELAHADAISSSSGLVIQNGNVVLDTNATLKAVTFVGATASTVSGSGNLDFSAGGVIDMALDASITHTFSCGITGSPAVRMASANAANKLSFSPTGTNQQALGVITNPYYDGAGDKAQLILGGTTTGNTVDGITYQKPNSPSQHYGYTNKEGSGTWTVNGDVEQGKVTIVAGTLIINGTFTSSYQGLAAIPSGARLGGNLTYYESDARFGYFQVNSGGIVAPGNPDVAGGVGKITTSWGTERSDVATTTFKTGSIFEWQIGDDAGNVITDTLHVLRTTTPTNNNRSLIVEEGMILKILDAGGKVAEGSQLPVFTYDDGVTINMDGFANSPYNFDTSELGAGWNFDSLSLVDGGAGIIYLTGLSNNLVGDANGDGVVDSADYIMVKTHFGGAPAAGTAGTGGDFDGDGTVDWDDLQTLMTAYNAGPAANSIPEPATICLLAFGAMAMIRRRRG